MASILSETDGLQQVQAPAQNTAVDVEQPMSDDDHEQSVADYMTGLLERVRGLSANGGNVPARPDSPIDCAQHASAKPSVAQVAADSRSGVAIPPAVDEVAEKAPVTVPRAPAPEKTRDMSALRELANQHAQQALATHSLGRLTRCAHQKLLMAGASMLISFSLFGWVAKYPKLNVVALALTALAVFWSWQYCAVTHKISKSLSGTDASDASEPSASGTPKSTSARQ